MKARKKAKSTKRRDSLDWLTPIKSEGFSVIVTDFATVGVKPETVAWFQRHFERKGISQRTVQRRADAALVAMTSFLSERAWRAGDEMEEV